MDELDRDRHRPHALVLYKAFATGRLSPARVAKVLDCSERAAYRRAENDAAIRVFEPVEIYRDTGDVDLFSDLSGATAAGLVVVAPPTAAPTVGDIVRAALQLGSSVGRIQAAVDVATSPGSPGGVRIVGQEHALLREAITNLKRAAQTLEQQLHDLEPRAVVSER